MHAQGAPKMQACSGIHRPTLRLYSQQHRLCVCRNSLRGAVTDEDRAYMRRALELAKKAEGKTFPNPAVGCVVVKDGRVVGEGFHPKAGKPHAEVYALRGAGNQAEGATAYVTLEPCNHHGRTPPCSRALVDARVARVVVGVGDPNPLVASEGMATLERAGIQVVIMDGLEREACYDLNKDFMERMKAAAAMAAKS
ncbi:hypothetical protein PLESTB_001957100 [Pleodorina starrii]|uniref:Riboflavin biosynthesis protein PYRD, chloroplastic n=1 Tax=Pleodorina starrii TaxID=330485 RepID=A0A9W6C5V1_9CHLO|nr:hypothetical protein PLESTM_000934600 [Pleodorina starrii]GLC62901.1 hypothetical protein PLESTB_001957100 [Pleodorina starrii]GLC77191.1 hypothetical protein PLESTF_001896300 [Pleodorina starrii]